MQSSILKKGSLHCNDDDDDDNNNNNNNKQEFLCVSDSRSYSK